MFIIIGIVPIVAARVIVHNKIIVHLVSFSIFCFTLSTAVIFPRFVDAQEPLSCSLGYITSIPDLGDETFIQSNFTDADEKVYQLRGDVEYSFGDSRILADEVDLNRSERKIEARGNITFTEQNKLELVSDSLLIDLNNRALLSGISTYKIGSKETGEVQLIGMADEVDVMPDGSITLVNFSGTNCPEGFMGITVKSSRADIDLTRLQGSAEKVSVYFGNQRIIVIPKIWFPVGSVRQSGFLYPTFGHSKKYGATVEVPYYLNLAPNYDATPAVTVMSQRGVRLSSEFRHISENSQTEFYIEALPNDAERHINNRGGFLIDYDWHDGEYLYANLDSKLVSDRYYLNDFDDIFGKSDDDYLQQTASVDYRGDNFLLSSGVTRFIATSPSIESNEPFDRVPWIEFDQTLHFHPKFSAQSQLSFNNFRRESTNEGKRSTARVLLNSRFGQQYASLDIGIGGHYLGYENATTYMRDGSTVRNPDLNDSATVPMAIVDGRITFDQVVPDSSKTQWSLTPRMKYVRIDYEDQSDFPEFDTTRRLIENLEDLFAENRYVGGDRVGNTKQLTLAVSSELKDSQTKEKLFGFDIGQTIYYEDRKLMLEDEMGMPPADMNPNTKPENLDKSKRSDWFVGAYARLNQDWKTSASALLDDQDSNQVNQSSIELQRGLRAGSFRVVYRKSNDEAIDTEQYGYRVTQNFDSPWKLDLTHLYSAEEDESALAEVVWSYESCCWTGAITIGRDLDSDGTGNSYASVFFSPRGFGNR